MSKHRRRRPDWQSPFPPDTPVSERRVARKGEQGWAELVLDICCWPYCGNKHDRESPLCYDHLEQVFMFVKGRDDLFDAMLAKYTAAKERREQEANRQLIREQKLRESRGNQPGWIYYLSIDGKVKIGYTTDIVQRMRHYPPGSPLLGVHPGTPAMERDIHKRFVGSLVQGREWFRPDPDLIAHCERVVAEFGDPSRFEYRARDPYASKQYVGAKRNTGVRKTAA